VTATTFINADDEDAAELAGLNHADLVRAALHEAVTRRPYDVPLSHDRLLIAR
jgi:hypothetical protein